MKLLIVKIFKRFLWGTFSPILARVINAEELYRFNIDRERIEMLQKAFYFCSSNWVNGDYYEFGLYEGKTFIMAIKECQRYNNKFHSIGFDSFEGLPNPHKVYDGHIIYNKADQSKGAPKQKWSKGLYAYSIDNFKKNLKKAGIDEDCYSIHKGFYEDVLTKELQATMKKAAIVHIDCDLYISTKLVLKFMKPLVQTGTIILFDDYYCFRGDPEKGEALALSEFLKNNPEISIRHWYNYHFVGAAFIVKVKDL